MPRSPTESFELEERLRLSILRAFSTEALLVPEERFLHGPVIPKAGGKFQIKALELLYAEPTISEAERAALHPLGPDAWTEASQLVESHFEIEPAIPDRDLAVYSPRETGTEDRAQQKLIDQVDQIARLVRGAEDHEPELPGAVEETTEEQLVESELGLDAELRPAPTSAPAASELAKPTPPDDEVEDISALRTEVEAVEWDLAAAMDPSRLTPLPLVAAALEAVGLDEEQFGFLLRYGTLAPAGRKSEIKIAGLGMAEFSNRAAEWFKALGASKFPIQVIDDGSGQLTVYLLESVPA